MSVCKYCNFYKFGDCTILEKELEGVEDDNEANAIAEHLYSKCEDEYFDYQIARGERDE